MRSAVIVAAGNSARFGTDKLQSEILGKSVLQRSVDAFVGIANEIVVVGNWQIDGVKTVSGGTTRSESVKLGLDALSHKEGVVAIHDGARPFVGKNLVQRLFEEAEKFGSAVPCLPVTDTLWHQKETLYRCNREEFFTVQTPQVFCCDKIIRAFEQSDTVHTDESTLFAEVFGSVHFVKGEYSNKKITVPSDLPSFRVGVGFDVHAFGEGNGVVLGGVKIPYDKKLVGHSDADVLAHAVCDAVLSASQNRDIGVQFPDTDDKYLGANSLLLLARCVQLAQNNGFAVQNVSAVVVCQQPKISQYIEAMAKNLAEVLQISPSCVNISATTTERLGALGNGDGIAVQAQALLLKAY